MIFKHTGAELARLKTIWLLIFEKKNAAFTVFQRFQWKPKENDGVDQGINAVTPEHLREDQRRKSGCNNSI